MSGYNTVLTIRRLEEKLDKLGFMLCYSKYGYKNEWDVVGIKPKDDDSLPIYSRDAELFAGTIEELERWVQGVEWARNYDKMLFGKKHDTNREKKEQAIRNEQLVAILRQS